MWTIACLSLLWLLGASSNEVKREAAVAKLGSSIFLQSEVGVKPQKQEIIWTFISSHRSPLTILHHIPNYKEWAEPSEQFKLRLRFFRSNGSLMINGLKAGDQGDYILEVDNCELKVIHLSLFDDLLEAVILTNSSSSFVSTTWLLCNVTGDPQKYQWWKNGVEISQLHQLTDGNRSLIIMNPSIRDCGIYTCVASNPAVSIQVNYTLIIFDFHQEDIAIIVLSVMSPVLSVLQYLWYLKLNTDRAVSWVKCWRQFLDICNLMTCITTLMNCVTTLIRLIRIEGSYPVFVAACCTISLQFLTSVLQFAVRWLGCLQKRAAILGRTIAVLHFIMIIISGTALTFQPDYQGCEMSFIVWIIFFGAVIVGAVVFLSDYVVQFLFCRKENLETDPPDPSASNKYLMSDLERVRQSAFSDDIPSLKAQQSGLSLDDTLDSQINTETQESGVLEVEERCS
ncbi:uncharacterized protein LOC132394523 [Hypanus sabinus]|uniref:uncharacterized protein LOC132394523 n=1 Tax=Hypanus sabinus TaxID=79690 RepID=UPI0028C394DB|nr:uncharacterized protein LOC132394523 [Hypanus sabinus]